MKSKKHAPSQAKQFTHSATAAPGGGQNLRGLDAVVLRLGFYRDGGKALFLSSMAAIICLIFSIALSFYSFSAKENNVYFAAKPDGSLIEMVALAQPNQSDHVVASWLAGALIDTFRFDYFNLSLQINEASRKWFTEKGAQELISGLTESGNMQLAIDNKLLVNLSIDHTPIMIKKGRPGYSSSFLWKLQVPATISYRNETSQTSEKVVFTVIVARRSVMEDPYGLGIHSIIMTRQK